MPAPIPPATPASDLSPSAQTVLLFQNDRYGVRVFQEGKQSFLNVFDKQQQTQTLNRVPVSITPAKNPATDQTQYLATVGNDRYIVTINQKGTTELSILSGERPLIANPPTSLRWDDRHRKVLSPSNLQVQ